MLKSFPTNLMDPPRSTALTAALRASLVYKLVCLCLPRIVGRSTYASGIVIKYVLVGNTYGIIPCGQSPLYGDLAAVHPPPLHATIHSTFLHLCLHSRCCVNTYFPQSIIELFQSNSN